jgi:hypothetical protein
MERAVQLDLLGRVRRPPRKRLSPQAAAVAAMRGEYERKYGAPLSIAWKREATMAARVISEWGQAAASAGLTPHQLLLEAWRSYLADPSWEASRHPVLPFWRNRQKYLVEALDRARGILLAQHSPVTTMGPPPRWMDEFPDSGAGKGG